MLVDVLSWVTGLRTAGNRISHPIVALAMFASFSWEASAGAVNMVPSGLQPSQAPNSAIVCAIVGSFDLPQGAASAPVWFNNSVNVGFSSSSDARSAPRVSFVLSRVVTETDVILSLFWSLLLPLQRLASCGSVSWGCKNSEGGVFASNLLVLLTCCRRLACSLRLLLVRCLLLLCLIVAPVRNSERSFSGLRFSVQSCSLFVLVLFLSIGPLDSFRI